MHQAPTPPPPLPHKPHDYAEHTVESQAFCHTHHGVLLVALVTELPPRQPCIRALPPQAQGSAECAVGSLKVIQARLRHEQRLQPAGRLLTQGCVRCGVCVCVWGGGVTSIGPAAAWTVPSTWLAEKGEGNWGGGGAGAQSLPPQAQGCAECAVGPLKVIQARLRHEQRLQPAVARGLREGKGVGRNGCRDAAWPLRLH
jgi:hypothetical protein